jgi:micrococcal nuclease
VIDGDTVIIDDDRNSRVRYLGIDTPEIAIQDSPGDPMSEEAKNLNKKLVQGKTVKLEFDKEKYDVYGRILAYVYVDDLLVNEELLKQGLATVLIIEPNSMYSEIMFDSLEEAKNNKKGMWGELRTLVPPQGNSEFRVSLNNAHRYDGKRIVAKGRIIGTRKSDRVVVLNMEDKLDVVIFPDDWNNFLYFDIYPEKFYKGRTVEVIGRIKMRRGKPSIVVDHPMLLRSQE